MTPCIRRLAAATLLALLSACAATPATPQHAIAIRNVATPLPPAAPRRSDPDQRFEAALKLMKDHEVQQAQAAFLALTRDFPELSGPLTDLAILDAQQHQSAPAIAGLQRAVALNPRNAVAWNWLGSLYRERGDAAHAEQAYLQALAARPDYAAAHLNLGILYDVALRRPQDALAQYRLYRQSAGDNDLIVLAWIKELEGITPARVAIAGAQP